MAKKKVRYPKRKQQMIMSFIIVIFLAAITVVGAYAYEKYDAANKLYVMTFGGKQVPTEEYKLYLQQQKSMYESFFGGPSFWDTDDGALYVDQVKESALNSLVYELIMAEKGKELGFTLTDEEKAEAVKYVEDYKTSAESYSFYMPKISDERLTEIMSNSIIGEKVYEEMTKTYVPNEEEFKQQYADYLENSKQDYITVNVSYVVTDSAENAEKAKADLVAGKDVEAIKKEYTTDYEEGTEAEPVDIKVTGLPQDVIDKAYTMTAGELSDVMVTDNGFVVFRVDDVVEPNYDELKASQYESFIDNGKGELFQSEYEAIKGNYPYTLNEKAYKAVKITEI